MSWTRTYRLALYLLPGALRHKHGLAMEALFARELQRARERGRLDGVLAGAAGVWDAVRRGVYEQLRPGWGRDSAGERPDHSPSEWWNIDAHDPLPAGAALRERDGVRRLVMPTLLAAVGVAALAFVVTAVIVPRANVRLAAVMASDGAPPQSDRMMTIGELREAARSVRPATEPDALARAAAYEVELQKKLALAAACVVLALVGVAIALRIPRSGAWLVIGASLAVFWAYYVMLLAGEDLADRLVISPFVGMWWANALLLAAALLLIVSRRRSPLAPGGGEAVAVRG